MKKDTNSVLIEFMTPQKDAVRASYDYESLFASDAISQGIDSAQNNGDSGFLQYVHIAPDAIPPGDVAMSLYATPRTMESGFHHRHKQPFCGVGSSIGGSVMDVKYLIPVNPQIVSGSPFAHADSTTPVKKGADTKKQSTIQQQPEPRGSEHWVKR